MSKCRMLESTAYFTTHWDRQAKCFMFWLHLHSKKSSSQCKHTRLFPIFIKITNSIGMKSSILDSFHQQRIDTPEASGKFTSPILCRHSDGRPSKRRNSKCRNFGPA